MKPVDACRNEQGQAQRRRVAARAPAIEDLNIELLPSAFEKPEATDEYHANLSRLACTLVAALMSALQGSDLDVCIHFAGEPA